MKVLRELRALFSTYELAVGGLLIGYVFSGAALLFLFTGRSRGWMLFLLAIAALAHIMAWEFVRCPACGKPALKLFLLNRETGIGRFLFRGRRWPERVCSSCRRRLDVI